MDEKKKKELETSYSGGSQQTDPVYLAQEKLKSQMAAKPGAYQSPWQQTLDDTMKRIMNREKFSYDLNGDALWGQYKDQYTQAGKMAMMDTMGQAAQLTGGYGNTYAQRAGQQAYQGYLQGLNDKVPELYQLARSVYDQEGAALLDQAALLSQRENQAYGQYRDQMADWQTGYDRAYGEYMDQVNYKYQQDRDQMADDKWLAEFEEARRRYDQEWDAAQEKKKGDTNGDGGENVPTVDDFKKNLENAPNYIQAWPYVQQMINAGYDKNEIYSIFFEYFPDGNTQSGGRQASDIWGSNFVTSFYR